MSKNRPKNLPLHRLKISDTVEWQDRPTRVLGIQRVSDITLRLRLSVVEHELAEKERAELHDEKPRDVSFWTGPIASGLTVKLR